MQWYLNYRWCTTCVEELREGLATCDAGRRLQHAFPPLRNNPHSRIRACSTFPPPIDSLQQRKHKPFQHSPLSSYGACEDSPFISVSVCLCLCCIYVYCIYKSTFIQCFRELYACYASCIRLSTSWFITRFLVHIVLALCVTSLLQYSSRSTSTCTPGQLRSRFHCAMYIVYTFLSTQRAISSVQHLQQFVRPRIFVPFFSFFLHVFACGLVFFSVLLFIRILIYSNGKYSVFTKGFLSSETQSNGIQFHKSSKDPFWNIYQSSAIRFFFVFIFLNATHASHRYVEAQEKSI